MTNWMTAAGIAMIAGGIATLIGFRHVLLGARRGARRNRVARGVVVRGNVVRGSVVRGERRRRDEPMTVPGQIRARRRRQALAAAAPVAALDAAPVTMALEPVPVPTVPQLAPVPTALVRPPAPGALEVGGSDGDKLVDDPTGTMAALPPAGLPVAPMPRRDGDRIQGWVRPHYEDDEPAPREYWTPAPETSYGWPLPVERLPRVNAYPSRFEPDPDPHRTDGPQWPSAQSRAERGWAERDAQPRRAAEDDEKADPDRRRSPVRRRAANDSRRTTDDSRRAASDLPVNDAEVPRRPRPRPRPSAGGGNATGAGNGTGDRSNVYRSRHAADPG